MKTITIQSTEEQINNFILDNELLQPKSKKFQLVETRVYVVDTHSLNSTPHWEVIDDIFMKLAENQGTVYTLEGFMKDFNIGTFDEPHYVIRFISVPV